MKVLLAHPGTQHAAALAGELDRRDLLGEFHTCFALRENGPLARWVSAGRPAPGARTLRNRIVRGVEGKKIHIHPSHEIRALYRIRRGADAVESIHQRNRRFQEAIPEASLRHADAVIGFDTSSSILAERARSYDKPLWLERTINHPAEWAQVQVQLSRRYPEWQQEPAPRLPDLVAAEEKEHRLAHRILVGSSFVARTLAGRGIDPGKIVVNPYGVSWTTFGAAEPEDADAGSSSPASRPVRFLFAGSIGARKGIPVLLEAWERLGWKKEEAELWLVGPVPDRLRRLLPAKDSIRIVGQVAKAGMAAIFRQCDVFTLPSFSEGFPLALLEAVASGLAIVTTPNTGAEDLRLESAASFISLVEAGSVEELSEAMKRWKESPPIRREIAAACEPLRARFSWSAYGDRWAQLLQSPAQ